MDYKKCIEIAKTLGWEEVDNDLLGCIEQYIAMSKKIPGFGNYCTFFDADCFVESAWRKAHDFEASPFLPGTETAKKDFMELAYALRTAELMEWALTDDDSHQMCRKSVAKGRTYELWEVRAWEHSGDDKYMVVHDFVDLDNYSEDDINDILESYDGLLDGLDDDDETRDALIAEAIFESNPMDGLPAKTFEEAAKCIDGYIRDCDKPITECPKIPEEQHDDDRAYSQKFTGFKNSGEDSPSFRRGRNRRQVGLSGE